MVKIVRVKRYTSYKHKIYESDNQENTIRSRNAQREIYKKEFKIGGERAYDMLYHGENWLLDEKYFKPFIDYLKDTIGSPESLVPIIELDHEWLAQDFKEKNPKLFDIKKDKKVTKYPNPYDLLKEAGYTLREHTMKNGKGIVYTEEDFGEYDFDYYDSEYYYGSKLVEDSTNTDGITGIKSMYRTRFELNGLTDRDSIPDNHFHSMSVICYYNNPEELIKTEYVFTLEKYNAEYTPTAYELQNDPSLMTPEWKTYLTKNNIDLKDLNPDFSDPFSLSFLMVRIRRTGMHNIDIISRYNHATFDVNNRIVQIPGSPNSTLNRNLDKITPGLHDSLFHYLNIKPPKVKSEFVGNVIFGADKKIYAYIKEVNNNYIGKDFYIDIHTTPHIIDKNIERIVGPLYIKGGSTGFVKNLALAVNDNDISNYIDTHGTSFPTINGMKGIVFRAGGEKQSVPGSNRVKWINDYCVEMLINDNGDIECTSDIKDVDQEELSFFNYVPLVSLYLPYIKKISNKFLDNNDSLEKIKLPNVQSIGDDFLWYNKTLTSIDLPRVQNIGNSFLYIGGRLKSINLPEVQKIGDCFLSSNLILESIELPNVQSIGHGFVNSNKYIKSVTLPNVQSIGNGFLYHNNSLKSITLPNVQSIGYKFLFENETLEDINIPKIQSIGDRFLYNNNKLECIDLPNVQSIGNRFLYFNNNSLKSITLPNVQSIGKGFLYSNTSLKSIEPLPLPNIQSIGNDFLRSHKDKSIIIRRIIKGR